MLKSNQNYLETKCREQELMLGDQRQKQEAQQSIMRQELESMESIFQKLRVQYEREG